MRVYIPTIDHAGRQRPVGGRSEGWAIGAGECSGTVGRVAQQPSDSLHLHVFSMHTSPLAQPGRGDAGGMNVYIDRSLRALLALDPALTVEVFTLRTDGGPSGTDTLGERAQVHSLVLPRAVGLAKADLPAFIPDFARAVGEKATREPSVLHGHYWLSGLAAREAYPHIPLVQTMHTTAAAKNARLGEGESPEPAERWEGEKQLVEEAATLVVNTKFEADQMRRYYGATDDRLCVINPGVDTSIFYPSTRVSALNTGSDTTAHLVFAGRPQPLKGPHLLVEALALLPEDLQVSLDIMGRSGGTYEQDLLERAHQLGLGQAVTLGSSVSAVELADVFRRADIVACPSSSETFGLVALEAQACGTAVIASKVDGLVEAVADGLTGILVTERTPHAWAQAIESLVRNPDFRLGLGAAGAARAGRMTWEQTARALDRIYRQLSLAQP